MSLTNQHCLRLYLKVTGYLEFRFFYDGDIKTVMLCNIYLQTPRSLAIQVLTGTFCNIAKRRRQKTLGFYIGALENTQINSR